jgi:RNA recognition motif-containing protein
MIFSADDDGNGVAAAGADEEFASFLSATAGTTVGASTAVVDEDEEEPTYESDGGTTYVDVNGSWVAEDELPPAVRRERKKKEKRRLKETQNASSGKGNKNSVKKAGNENGTVQGASGEGKKRKKAGFSSKNSAKWIYVTNLPLDATEAEIAAHFSKAGVIELDVMTQKPRIKLYKDGDILKGDCSVCFAMPESVAIALSVLDGSVLRADGVNVLGVTAASFQQKGDELVEKAAPTMKQRKVAQLAARQAMSWDDGSNGRLTGGIKGLTILVMKHLFTLEELTKAADEDVVLQKVQDEIVAACGELGSIEKITMFSKHPDGVAIVKFKEVEATTACIEKMDGLEGWRNGAVAGKPIACQYWDGATDYTNRDAKAEEKEEEKRLDEFGDWLDNQEVPEEFRVRTE